MRNIPLRQDNVDLVFEGRERSFCGYGNAENHRRGARRVKSGDVAASSRVRVYYHPISGVRGIELDHDIGK